MIGELVAFLDERLGDHAATEVTPMAGGGSCEIFAVDRPPSRWVLRRAPQHASSSTAHDVLREFRILDAIKDANVRVPRPVLACDDPAVFVRPFFIMERVDGTPVRSRIPEHWTDAPEHQPCAFFELVDAIADVHAVDWRQAGLGDLGRPDGFLERQVSRWLAQLDSYGGRDLPVAHELGAWLDSNRPVAQPPSLFHGDYKLDNVLFAATATPQLLAIVDWEMASIGDPIVDLAWAMVFHPVRGNTTALGTSPECGFDIARVPSRETLLDRYAKRSGRDLAGIAWYDVFVRWKLAIVLEGSYAKWVRGRSSNAVHELFGPQAESLFEGARALIA